jgi:hypothetical protein
MATQLRALTNEERVALQQRARSRTEPARLVERTQIVWDTSQGEPIATIARRRRLDPRTVVP